MATPPRVEVKLVNETLRLRVDTLGQPRRLVVPNVPGITPAILQASGAVRVLSCSDSHRLDIEGVATLEIPTAAGSGLGLVRVSDERWIGLRQSLVSLVGDTWIAPHFIATGSGATKDNHRAAGQQRPGLPPDRVAQLPQNGADAWILVADLALLQKKIGAVAESPLSNLLIAPTELGDDFVRKRMRAHATAAAMIGNGTDQLVAAALAAADAENELDAITGARPESGLYRAALQAASMQWALMDLTRIQPQNYDAITALSFLTAALADPRSRHAIGDAKSSSIAMPLVWQAMCRMLEEGPRLTVLQDQPPVVQAEQRNVAEGHIVLLGDLQGQIEDCGCIGPPAGGLSRLADAVLHSAGDEARPLYVGIGNYLGSVRTIRGSADLAKLGARLVALIGESALMNYGPNDLLQASLHPSITDEMFAKHQRCITINVTSKKTNQPIGKAIATEYNDQPCLVLGVAGSTGIGVMARERALMHRLFEFDDAVETVRRCLQALELDAGIQVIVVCCGVGMATVGALADVVPNAIFIVSGENVGFAERMRKLPSIGQVEGSVVVAHHGGSSSATAVDCPEGKPVSAREVVMGAAVAGARVLEVLHQRSATRVGHETAALMQPAAVAGESPAGLVGSQSCRACHRAEYSQWSTTPHATAMQTLADVDRRRVDYCVQCHVTGFMANGFNYSEATDHLAGVGCEVCHGPGGKHVTDPASPMIRLPPKELCLVCHTSEHSAMSEHSMARYWSGVLHK